MPHMMAQRYAATPRLLVEMSGAITSDITADTLLRWLAPLFFADVDADALAIDAEAHTPFQRYADYLLLIRLTC